LAIARSICFVHIADIS